MKLLVTGLAGFTGTHLGPEAKRAGWQVLGLDSDLNDLDALTAEVSQKAPDAVVHLAAISHVAHPDTAQIYRVNTVGTTNLLDALAGLATPPMKVLLASSANVYGNSEVVPIVETQMPAPVNHYAVSKLAMELMARTFQDRLPIVTVRPFNYIGPGQSPRFLVPKLVDHFVQKRPVVRLGNLDVRREFNDVRMVCQAYLRLIEAGVAGQTYNVCTGQSYSIGQLLDTLRAITGHGIGVTVEPALVRQQEVYELYGDPARLILATGTLTTYTLHDTLQWMVRQACELPHE